MRYRYFQNNGRFEKKALIYSRQEHGIALTDIDEDAVALCHRLQSAGYEAYIVGGAVRDLLLGQKPKDFDLATGARPQHIKHLIRNSRLIGQRFKLIHVFFDNKIIELATFRSTADGTTGNTFGTVEEDVMRRDFTMNALFYDPVKEVIIDYVGGVEDIRHKVLKPVIPIGVIFKDDPVRMIRAVKYCAIAGWQIPPPVAAKIRAQGSLLAAISPSRLTEEITKIIKSSAAAAIIQRLEETGLYVYLQPAASVLLKKDKRFRDAYFADISAAHAPASAHTSAAALASTQAPPLDLLLRALIAAYALQETGWEAARAGAEAAGEWYKTIFARVRQFVLPMNPPRIELERALRALFTEQDISLKKIRLGSAAGHPRARGGRNRRNGGGRGA